MNRRRLLTLAVAGVAVIPATAALPALPVVADAHPDADLLAAWSSYRENWLETGSEGEFASQIERLPAHTAAGLAVKLEFLFMHYGETEGAERAVMSGRLAGAENVCEDYRHRLLFDLISDARRLDMKAA
jgi:hypothetical protein